MSSRTICFIMLVVYQCTQYADDHQFYHIGRDLPTTISKLRDSRETATKWYDLNLLAVNLKKNQTLIIGNNHNHENNIEECAIFVEKEKFNTTETLQLLRVTIDSKLNFNNHISNICKKRDFDRCKTTNF